VGDRSGYVRDLEDLAHSLGLRENVRFTGYRTDVAALMHLSDLVVVPSLREAQTRVIPQALACGRPVVAYATGGIPEVIEHDVTGWLVPTGDVAALAGQIQQALRMPEQRNEVSARARQFAERQLTFASATQATLSVYERAVHWARRRLWARRRH